MQRQVNSKDPGAPADGVEGESSGFTAKRFGWGCFVITFVPLLFCIGLVLTFQRTLSIERGFKLTASLQGDFKFDAWGNGEWKAKRDGLLYVASQESPFTLLVSIRSNRQDLHSIEVIATRAKLANGKVLDLAPFLTDPQGSIIEPRRGTFAEEYFVLHFEKALESNQSLEIELEFETTEGEIKTRHHFLIEIPGYEKRKNSLYFWESMMSV